MEHWIGQVVQAQAGRDAGGLFAVVGVDGQFLLLADGKRRKSARPKRKKPRHVRALPTPPAAVLDAARAGQPVSDRALRRTLAACRKSLGEPEPRA